MTFRQNASSGFCNIMFYWHTQISKLQSHMFAISGWKKLWIFDISNLAPSSLSAKLYHSSLSVKWLRLLAQIVYQTMVKIWHTLSSGPLCRYRIDDCFSRNVRFTCLGVGCCFSMKSKKLYFLFGKRVVSKGADPNGEVWTTTFWTASTFHAFITSQGLQFTAFWGRFDEQGRSQPSSSPRRFWRFFNFVLENSNFPTPGKLLFDRDVM